MANTTNFGWETPDDTDLVKDGAAAIRTLAGAIDTSLVDLKGGTTGQVLSKATNTDMDFTWVAQDDSNAIQNAIVDAKGDLISATAADTPARLAVGTNGQVLTADSTEATGLKWAAASSGALTKIVSTTFSAVSTQAFLGCFTSTYRTYKIVFSNIITSTNADMQIKFYTSTSTLLDDYSGGVMQISTAGTPTAAFNNSYLTVFSFGKINSSAGNQFAGGEITLFQGSELVGGYGATSGITSWQSGGGVSFRIGYYGSLNIDGNDAITGFQLLPSTGTISGTATVYGLEK